MDQAERGLRSGELDAGISEVGFRRLAEFRHRIRQFLHFSEDAARSRGIEPQQHQLLLAIKGLPPGTRPTIHALAEQLCLRHHSTVELVDRLAQQGAVSRRQSHEDHREVLVELTPHGEALLRRLSILHWAELRISGPALCESLGNVLRHSERSHGRGR